MARVATHLLPLVEQFLIENGIDVTRCTSVSLSYAANDRVTEFTVTMFAIDPEDSDEPA